MIEDEDIINEFIEEAREHLNGIENDLLAVESQGVGEDKTLINDIFRAIHSVKGGAGFLGLENIKNLAHVQENILNKLRNDEIQACKGVMNALLTTIDLLSQLVENWQESNDTDIAPALQKLESALAAAESGDDASADEVAGETTDAMDTNPPLTQDTIDQLREQGQTIYQVDVRVDDDLAARGKTLPEFLEECMAAGEILQSSADHALLISRDTAPESVPVIFHMVYATILDKTIINSLIPVPEERIHVIMEVSQLENNPLVQEEPPQSSTKKDKAPAKATPKQESTLRVNIHTLDKLMGLTSELVLARNQLTKTIGNNGDRAADSLVQRLDSITSNLQLTVMSTRMQPIGKVFNKFRRVVRDLSNLLGKQINLEIEGETVELDKTIIETINDPITHLVRNSCDHGLETPDERKANGKSEAGTLTLRAFHEAGQVVIEIIDDGRGVCPQLVKKKALATGNFDPEVINQLNDKDLVRLIFKPGFSTATEVTEISGRGVGMDVVHTNFAKLGGVVDVESEVNKGTVVSVKLPLTLAIIPSLLVNVQNEVFAIPQANLVELVCVNPNEIKERLHYLGNHQVLRLRGSLLPLVDIAEVLQIPKTYTDPDTNEEKEDRRQKHVDRRARRLDRLPRTEDPSSKNPERARTDRRRNLNSYLNLIVVASGNSRYGLIVDDFLDSEEIVVKPLDSYLSDCKCYAGATIQGDGRVALILDVMGISEIMQISESEKDLTDAAAMVDTGGSSKDSQEVLLFNNGTSDNFAVPLTMVDRIERVQASSIDMTASRPNMQYRGGSLPLFSIEQVANVEARKEQDHVNILIFTVAGKEMGLVTNQVEDIEGISAEFDETTFHQTGILGSAIIGERTTLLVDLYGVVNALHPEWTSEMKVKHKDESKPKVLLVEDSSFYRKHIKEFLESSGCEVTACEDGEKGLAALEENPDVAMVITDIEMPNMDGLDMTRAIRKNTRFSNLPVVAITSLAGSEAEQEGLAAGVDQYLIKLDKEEIAKTLQKYL